MRHACLATDRLGPLTERVRDAGYQVEQHDSIRGRPQTFFHDPFGNLLELTRLLAPYA